MLGVPHMLYLTLDVDICIFQLYSAASEEPAPVVEPMEEMEEDSNPESGEEEVYEEGDPCDLCEGVHATMGEHDLNGDENKLLDKECQTIQLELMAAEKTLASLPEGNEVRSNACWRLLL